MRDGCDSAALEEEREREREREEGRGGETKAGSKVWSFCCH